LVTFAEYFKIEFKEQNRSAIYVVRTAADRVTVGLLLFPWICWPRGPVAYSKTINFLCPKIFT